MIHFFGGEATAPKTRTLDKGHVYGADGGIPIPEGEVGHARVAAIPEIVPAGYDLANAIYARAVFNFVMRFIGRAPIAAKGISQAVGKNVVAGVDAISGAVIRVVRGSGTVEREAQDLAPEAVEILRRVRVEAIAHVQIEMIVRADG